MSLRFEIVAGCALFLILFVLAACLVGVARIYQDRNSVVSADDVRKLQRKSGVGFRSGRMDGR